MEKTLRLMGNETAQQSFRILEAFMLGTAAGLAYELLRASERALGKKTQGLLETAYSLCAGAAVFAYFMADPSGHGSIWELAAVLVGFLFCTYISGRKIQALLAAAKHSYKKFFAKNLRFIKKSKENAKNVFKNK